MHNLSFLFGLFISLTLASNSIAVVVDVKQSLDALVKDEDTDNDQRITVDDPHIAGTSRGDKRFWLVATNQQKYEISGTYHLSNLLQELSLLADSGKESAEIDAKKIFEDPAERISRSIRELYWDALTRRIDEKGFAKVVSDEKTTSVDSFRHLYVPYSDSNAFDCLTRIAQNHPETKVKVSRLPEKVTPTFVRKLDGYHGLLTLAMRSDASGSCQGVPFVVPGGRFNEMYGWDSYFITLGLLQDKRLDLAKSMVENFVYEISNYGKILNANRTYYLTRSQPPFLTAMALAVYEKMPKDAASKQWLQQAFTAAIQEYYGVWMNPDRLTKTGLSRYFDSGFGPPPEVEPGHFDVLYTSYAKKAGMDVKSFETAYRSGKLKVPELDRYFVHDRCMRESGHDTSYRLEGRCADLVTVDLNSLLYRIESDIAETIEQRFSGSFKLSSGKTEQAAQWRQRAAKRKELINRYLWNAQQGMFFDYDYVKGQQLDYVSATTLYPLWSGVATKDQAESLIQKALPLLEMPGGIVASTEESRGSITAERPPRQWDYPNGWAPHQILTWLGLIRYDHAPIAHRLIDRWLYTITVNAAHYNGTVPEKFDVVTRSHQVFAEYGNVGTKFSYITREGFGWTNTSYQLGLSLLPPELRKQLNQLIPPEWSFQRKDSER